MNQYVKWGVLIVAVLSMVGCNSSYDNGGEYQYLSSRNGPDIVVPSPLTRSNMSYFYHLPAQDKDARISIKPPKV